MVSRRKFLAGVSAAIPTAIVGGSFLTGWNGRKWRLSSGEHSLITEGPTVAVEPVVEGLQQPLALENPIDGYMYVADKFGQLYLYLDGELLSEPILDISDRLIIDHGEQGLLGLEFHPDFENNRKFYLRYSSPPREGTPEGYSHTFVLSEFQVTDDYREVIASSERAILEIPEPGRMHNAGDIEFGPEEYLYVTLGDGGGDGRDGSGPFNRGPGSHARDWYWVNVGGNGQDVTKNLLGSVLRIDVNERDGEKPYTVPEGNPLTNKKGLDEHYAWGFRNPYSLSFDGEDLYVADVGSKLYGEINLVKKGENYGWNVKEGSACHNNFPPIRALSAAGINIRTLPICPNETPAGEELNDPVVAYPHPPGVAVIGGYVYRNSTVPAITDKYVFGDLTGQLFAASPKADNGFWRMEELFVHEEGQSETNKLLDGSLLSIDQGNDGELFALTASQEGGKVKKIVSV